MGHVQRRRRRSWNSWKSMGVSMGIQRAQLLLMSFGEKNLHAWLVSVFHILQQQEEKDCGVCVENFSPKDVYSWLKLWFEYCVAPQTPPPQTPLSGCLGSFANPHNYWLPGAIGVADKKNWLLFFFGKGEEAGKSLSRTQSVWIVICLWLDQSVNCGMSSAREGGGGGGCLP